MSIGLVCKKSPIKKDDILQKRPIIFKEPTNRSHPVPVTTTHTVMQVVEQDAEGGLSHIFNDPLAFALRKVGVIYTHAIADAHTCARTDTHEHARARKHVYALEYTHVQHVHIHILLR